jgi:hypothetical protein
LAAADDRIRIRRPNGAICSSLIAQAFQSIRYPILPDLSDSDAAGSDSFGRKEIFHIRHHSLFTPRDFDLSPYFEIVKPRIRRGFDHRGLAWDDEASDDRARSVDETAP